MEKCIFKELMRYSLQNAARFMEDAEILIKNSSFGHALALGILADEEAAKGYLCWFVAKGLIPASSEIVKDVFKDHYIKDETMIWLHVMALLTEQIRSGELQIEEVIREGLMLKKEQLEKDLREVAILAEEREDLRRSGTYVDLKDNKISSPENIDRRECEEVLHVVRFRLGYVKKFIEDLSKTKNLKLIQEIFNALPSEVKESGYLDLW